jgi:iron(III) transport system permease protein
MKRPRGRAGSAVWYVVAALMVFVVITPVVKYYALALDDGGAAFGRLPDIPNIGRTLWNTLLLASAATAFAVVMALALAKAVLHVPQRFRAVASLVPLLPLVIPASASVIGFVFIFSPTVGYGNWLLRQLPFVNGADGPINVYSVPAIIVIAGMDLTGIVFTFVYARLKEIRGPLEAAAHLSGASSWRSFTTITLPLLRPSLVAGIVVAFLLGLGQFTVPVLLGTRIGFDVITTEIFRTREDFPIDYALTAALGLPLLVVGLLSIVLQRVVIGDQRKYVTQSGGGGAVSTKSSVWALLFVLAYGAISVFLPLLAILLVAFSPYWNGDLTAIEFTMRHVESGLGNPEVVSSVITSATTSLAAVWIALPLGFIAALAMTGPFRAPRIAQYGLDLSFLAPLAVPRAVLGLVVLYVFLQPPFNLYGTYTLFIVGYVFVALPFALRAQHASLVSVNASLFEAARVSGAGKLRTIFQIAVPLTRSGMTAAATMMMVILSHDFAVSIMVRSPGNHVMGTLLYEYWDNGVYPQVAVMALIVTFVTSIGLGITLWVGGRSALERV